MTVLTEFIVKRPLLKRWFIPLSEWYKNAAGYRKLGLRYAIQFSSIGMQWIGLNSILSIFFFFFLINRFITLTDNRFDDLLPEESETVQTAIKRLPPKEAYDRVFRIRRAFQVG